MVEARDPQSLVLRFLVANQNRALLDDIAKHTNLDPSAVMRTLLALREAGYIALEESEKSIFSLTPEGESYARVGLPERRLAEAVAALGGETTLEEANRRAELSADAGNIAIGWIVRRGWGRITPEGGRNIIHVTASPPEALEETLLQRLLQRGTVDSQQLSDAEAAALRGLSKRNLTAERPSTLRVAVLVKPPPASMLEAKEEEYVSSLTSEMITSGKWREVKLRQYDVTAQPPPTLRAGKHFYLEFLEEVRRVLLAMGFEEAEGPYVETEFWNFDVLFQAQDHPAREIHDSYHLKHPTTGKLPSKGLVNNVRLTHERGWKTGSTGWRYTWDQAVARRLVLRTQTTAVSMRYLSRKREPPAKMFCLSKVFRPDILDSKHSMEFTQCEGIMAGEGLNVRHLLGFLKAFAEGLGLGEVKFRPGYFPFTEPSVESFVKHPTLGWVEFVGAGMFRPEVLAPVGVKVPVLAWGIGVDRLAMTRLGVDDIRQLCSRELDFLREH